MTEKTLSVVVPCYNEVDNIPLVLEDALSCPLVKEVVFVDDGSTDGSRELLLSLQSLRLSRDFSVLDADVKFAFHRKNKGKGAALHTGLSLVTGRYVVLQDADLEYSSEQYEKLMEPIRQNVADVVYGSRFLGARFDSSNIDLHAEGNRLVSLWTNMVSGTDLSDVATGCKMFRSDVLDSLQMRETGWGFDFEFAAAVRAQRLRVAEVAIPYYKKGVLPRKSVIATWSMLCAARYSRWGDRFWSLTG